MNASLKVLAVSALALAAALPAHASGGGRWNHHGGYQGHHGNHGHHGHHGGHRNIWGPLIVGGLIGAALANSNANAYSAPQTLVVPVNPHFIPQPLSAPPVSAPPPRAQYYCAPYRAYFPAVSSCPEPWYVMPL